MRCNATRITQIFDQFLYHVIPVIHYMKSVQIRSFFWSVVFCIRTEDGDLQSINIHIQSKYRNKRTRKLRIRHFLHSDFLQVMCFFFQFPIILKIIIDEINLELMKLKDVKLISTPRIGKSAFKLSADFLDL